VTIKTSFPSTHRAGSNSFAKQDQSMPKKPRKPRPLSEDNKWLGFRADDDMRRLIQRLAALDNRTASGYLRDLVIKDLKTARRQGHIK